MTIQINNQLNAQLTAIFRDHFDQDDDTTVSEILETLTVEQLSGLIKQCGIYVDTANVFDDTIDFDDIIDFDDTVDSADFDDTIDMDEVIESVEEPQAEVKENPPETPLDAQLADPNSVSDIYTNDRLRTKKIREELRKSGGTIFEVLSKMPQHQLASLVSECSILLNGKLRE